MNDELATSPFHCLNRFVVRAGFVIVALVWLAGCASTPSPFEQMVSPAVLDGAYRNSASHSYWHLSLWQLLGPLNANKATLDEATDLVRLRVAPDGLVTATLIRDEREIATQVAAFKQRNDHLHRDKTWAKSTAFVVLWVLGDRKQELGVAAPIPGIPATEGDKPRIMLTDGGSGTLWVIAFPIAGAGGGPSDRYYFDRVDMPTTATSRPNDSGDSQRK